MTQDEIIRMAREAGIDVSLNKSSEVWAVDLETFAALVAAHEREKLRCAIILNDDGGTYSTHESKEQLEWMLNMSPAKEVIETAVLAEREACAKVCEGWGAFNDVAQDIAAAIRVRSN